MKLALSLLLILFFAAPAGAADGYTVAAANVAINEHGVCRLVASTSGSRYVPTKTAAEWSDFIAKATGVTIAPCTPCSLPWGGSITHGASISAYASGSVACGGTCPAPTTRVCNNGILSGTGNFASCTVGACANCTLDGVTVNHGASRNFFSATTAANCTTIQQSRTCTNGTLSGSATYNRANCTNAPVYASCPQTPLNGAIPGWSGVSWIEWNVSGQICQRWDAILPAGPHGSTHTFIADDCGNGSQTWICNNGTWQTQNSICTSSYC